MTPEQEQYLNEERRWFDENQPAYNEAINNLSDSTYVRGLLRGVEEKMGNALAYNPREDAPHVAVFILGELQAKMNRLLTDLAFVDDYEARRKDFHEALEEINAESDGSHSGQPDAVGQL